MSGILTTLCGGLVLIAGWQYRHRLAGGAGSADGAAALVLRQQAASHAELCTECLKTLSACVTRVYLSCFGTVLTKPPICPLYRRPAPVFLSLRLWSVAITQPLVLARPRYLPGEQETLAGFGQLGAVVILPAQVRLGRDPVPVPRGNSSNSITGCS